MSDPTIVQIVAFDNTGDTAHRMKWPGEQLALQNPNWRVINLDSSASERFIWGENADLLVIYQSHDVDLIPLINKRRAKGLKTLVEYNDNFYEPPSASAVFREWSSPLLHQIYELFMVQADGVIVTTPELSKIFSTNVNREFHILENHYPFEIEPLDSLINAKLSKVSFGWAGSLGHASDILSVVPVIAKILGTFPTSKFCFMGNTELATHLRLPEEQVEFHAWGSISEYLKFLRQIPIGIVPMLNTPYNRCRSDVKAVEMISQGTLPLLPPAAPYGKLISATNLPTWNSWEELAELTCKFLSEPEERNRLLESCYSYIKSQRLGFLQKERSELYQKYFPEKFNSGFSWPLKTGFFELSGTRSPGPIHSEIISVAASKLRSGETAVAIQVLVKGYEENPACADLLLAACRICFELGYQDDGLKSFEHGRKLFPRDLRFTIEAMRHVDSEMYAHQCFAVLSDLKPANRVSFELELTQALKALLQNEKISKETVEKFLPLFPYNQELQSVVAEYAYAAGDLEYAEQAFTQIAERSAYQPEDLQPRSVHYAYAASLAEGIGAQKKNGPGW